MRKTHIIPVNFLTDRHWPFCEMCSRFLMRRVFFFNFNRYLLWLSHHQQAGTNLIQQMCKISSFIRAERDRGAAQVHVRQFNSWPECQYLAFRLKLLPQGVFQTDWNKHNYRTFQRLPHEILIENLCFGISLLLFEKCLFILALFACLYLLVQSNSYFVHLIRKPFDCQWTQS